MSSGVGQGQFLAATDRGIALKVVKLPEAKCGFVLSPGAEWSNVVSRGRAGSDGWSRTMNACPKPWRDFTLWLCLPDGPSIGHRDRATSIMRSTDQELLCTSVEQHISELLGTVDVASE